MENAAPPEAPSPARWLIAAALIAVYVIWGSTYLVMRVALETIPPFMMGGSRFLIAGALLFAFLRLRGAPSPSRVEWIACAKVGVLLLVIGNGFVAYAEQRVSSSVAAMVVATMPLWMALLSSFTGQRPSRLEWIGLLLGFVGVALLQLSGQIDASPWMVITLLFAPVSWAAGSVWSKKLPLPKGPMATAAEMLIGGTSMLIVSLARGEHVVGAASARSIGALAFLIGFGSIVAFSAYGFLLRSTRPAIATSYAYVNPVVALVLGVALGGEHAGAMTWIAAAIILAGVVILSIQRARSAPPKPA
ncbi:MAG: drug/metabolite exporter YedA [Byssovorax sp.]